MAKRTTAVLDVNGSREAVGKPVETLVIPPLDLKTFEVRLVGDSPLIMHKWSEKAKRQILDKHMKRAKQAKEAKDPQKDYEESMYRDDDGHPVMPVTAFKQAAVSACSHVDGLTKVVTRGAFHIQGEFVRIIGEPSMREDMVRVGMGTADIRYRAEFKKWETRLTIRHNERVMSAGQIVNLLSVAGFAVGVGEWRPERDGQYGMFHVEGAA